MVLRPEMKRYTVGTVLAIAGYVLALVGVGIYFRNSSPTGAAAFAAAVLPAVPILVLFALFGRLLAEMEDEYVRMLLVRQSLVATAFALSVATVWGFLESFGLVGHVPAYWVAVIWFSGLGVGGGVNAVLESRGRR